MKTLIFVIAIHFGFICVMKGQKTSQQGITSSSGKTGNVPGVLTFQELTKGMDVSGFTGTNDGFVSHGSHDSNGGHTTRDAAIGSKRNEPIHHDQVHEPHSSGHASDGFGTTSVETIFPTDGFVSDGFGKASSGTNDQLDGFSVTNTDTVNSSDGFTSDGFVTTDSETLNSSDGFGTTKTETSGVFADPNAADGFVSTSDSGGDGFVSVSTETQSLPNSNTREQSAASQGTSAASNDGFIVDPKTLPTVNENRHRQRKPTTVELNTPNSIEQSRDAGSPEFGIRNRLGGSTISIRNWSRDRGTIGQRNFHDPVDRPITRQPLRQPPRVITRERPTGRNPNRERMRPRQAGSYSGQDSVHVRNGLNPREQPFPMVNQITSFGRPRSLVLFGDNPQYAIGSTDRGSIGSNEFSRPLSGQTTRSRGFLSGIPPFYTTGSFDPNLYQSIRLPSELTSSESFGMLDFRPMSFGASSGSFMDGSTVSHSSPRFRTRPFRSSSFSDSSIPRDVIVSPQSRSHQFSTGGIGMPTSSLTGGLHEPSYSVGFSRGQDRSSSIVRSQRPSGSLVGLDSFESSFPRSSTSTSDFRPSSFTRSFSPTFSSTSGSGVRSPSFPRSSSSVHSSLPGVDIRSTHLSMLPFLHPTTSRPGVRSFSHQSRSPIFRSTSGSSFPSPSHPRLSLALQSASGTGFPSQSHTRSSSALQSNSGSVFPSHSHSRSSPAHPPVSGSGFPSPSYPRYSSALLQSASGSGFPSQGLIRSSSALQSVSGSGFPSPSHSRTSPALPSASGSGFPLQVRSYFPSPSHPRTSSALRSISRSDSRSTSRPRSSSAFPPDSGSGYRSPGGPRSSSAFSSTSGSGFGASSFPRSFHAHPRFLF